MLSCSYISEKNKHIAKIDVLDDSITFIKLDDENNVINEELIDLKKIEMKGLTSKLMYADKELVAAYDARYVTIFDERITKFTREHTRIIGVGRYTEGYYVAYRTSEGVYVRIVGQDAEDSSSLTIPYDGVRLCYQDGTFYLLSETGHEKHSHELILIDDREVKRIIPLHIGSISMRDYQMIVRKNTVFISFIGTLDNRDGVYSGIIDLNNIAVIGFMRAILDQQPVGAQSLTGIDFKDGYVFHYTSSYIDERHASLAFHIGTYSFMENKEDPKNFGKPITKT